MDLSRRTMIAGAAGLPALPLASVPAGPPVRRMFVYEPQDGVREIIKHYLQKWYDAEIHAHGPDARQAFAALRYARQTFGAVYWQVQGPFHTGGAALIWTPSGQRLLPYRYTVRQLYTQITGITSWPAKPIFSPPDHS